MEKANPEGRSRETEPGSGGRAANPAPGQIFSNIFINDPERGSKQSVNEICRGY